MRVLFILLRGFGDSIIASQIARGLAQDSSYNVEVLTTETSKPLFSGLGVHTTKFGYASLRPSRVFEAANLMQKCISLRKNQYQIVINFTGDLREDILGFIINPRENYSPFWNAIHPFRNMVYTTPKWLPIRNPIEIPVNLTNVYKAQEHILKNCGINFRFNSKAGTIISNRVGLHPFASQECRMWNVNKWEKLVDLLVTDGHKVVVYGTNLDFQKHQEFKNLSCRGAVVEILPITDYVLSLKLNSVNVTMDSFALHASFAANTNTILINGANNHEIWMPPNTQHFSAGLSCRFYPCYNSPKCLKLNNERYVCVNGIDPLPIFRQIKKFTAT